MGKYLLRLRLINHIWKLDYILLLSIYNIYNLIKYIKSLKRDYKISISNLPNCPIFI
jgi:hypothetical protein